MNKYLYIKILLITVIINSCNGFSDSSIYEKYPKKSKLTLSVLENAERIIYNNNYLILFVDNSSNSDSYDPFLLFYKKNDLCLFSACYIPGRIDSISKKGEILGRINAEKIRISKYYPNELPGIFKLKLEHGNNNGLGNKCHKEIVFMKSDTLGAFVNIIYRSSENIYAGYNNPTKQEIQENWNIYDTINIPIDYLCFNNRKYYKNRTISIISSDNNGNLIEDKMIILDTMMIKSFYNSIWDKYSTFRYVSFLKNSTF